MTSLPTPLNSRALIFAAFALAAPCSLNAAAVASPVFGFSPLQGSATDSANLVSIEIAGETYFDFIVPESYTNIDLNGDTEIRLDTVEQTGGVWEEMALEAFQSSNLNHYQQLDAGNLDSTWRLSYGGSGLVFDANLYLVVTERNGNNPFIIEAFDSSDNSLGVLSVTVGDYSSTGATSLSTDRSRVEDINGAVYPLSDLVAPGSANLAYIEITNNFTNVDGGDGKVFFFGEEATGVPEPASGLFGLVGATLLLVRRKFRS